MVTTDSKYMIVETSCGVYSVLLDKFSKFPGYSETKNSHSLDKFNVDIDDIIWNDDFDMSEGGFYEYGKRLELND